MDTLSRRSLLVAGFGLLGSGALAACSSPAPSLPAGVGAGTASAGAGQRLVDTALTARPVTLDLGGSTVATWAYGDSLPGPLIRATAGDRLRIRVENRLPADTTVHWHGIALANGADGVPGVTQDPIAAEATYTYDFTAPDPGTYFYHPHVGVQLDRGLYAPLIIDDPQEPGAYDHEWILVLDDWVDGTGRTPDEVLAALTSSRDNGGMPGMDHGNMGGMEGMDMSSGSSEGMAGMDHGAISAGDSPYGDDAGDVSYPHYLVNGRVPADPEVLTAKPGQKVRLRIINAAADTIFTVALGGHRMTVTHTDGFPVQPQDTDALYLGMGERYDATVTLAEGVFPFVAVPLGKDGQAMALVRTGAGNPPPSSVRPAELDRSVLIGADLTPADSARLEARDPDVSLDLAMTGQMNPYEWGFKGAPYGQHDPVQIQEGQRVRLTVANHTMMAHPLHLHGHTFALPNGLRKDTVLIAPMQSMAIDVQADNPGNWLIHCHNIYHAEAGMTTELRYRP